MKKKTLRQQLRYIRVIMLPRPKRTPTTYMEVMEEEANQKMKKALETLLNPVPPCYQGIEGGHDFIETINNTATCIYCKQVINV